MPRAAALASDLRAALREGPRDLATAQHEAAHVVVGVALGLRLRAASVGRTRDPDHGWIEGWALFDQRGAHDAWAIMLAAGVYYEDRRGTPSCAEIDRVALVKMCMRNANRARAYVIAAGAILESRRAAWDAVTRALLERDITGADVERLARGEAIHAAAE
jgi:hypothetical protein